MFDMTALRNSTGEIELTIARKLEDPAGYFRQRLADDPEQDIPTNLKDIHRRGAEGSEERGKRGEH
ncbi:MAG: hypothetical protein HYX92_07725 [Chloroflexi bacterium]|nr:hypothetical protein [Chloroflexota bacterium]